MTGERSGITRLLQLARRLATVSLLPLLLACTQTLGPVSNLEKLVPLYPAADSPSPHSARLLAPTPAVLRLTPEMRDFADRYAKSGRTPRQRLHLLHNSLRSKALLALEYDPAADGTAAEVFFRGRANCLSYAHLFISLARYVGLDARYQTLNLRPEWSRHGNRIALRQHVNVLVKLRKGEHYMVDIDPVQRSAVAGARSISDSEALGLHHNNLAMKYLYEERIENSYVQAVRAIQVSPATDYLWVNLGAIYNRASNGAAAEMSYMTALQLNSDSRSAMNNLQILYLGRGDMELAAHWGAQVAKHRQRNPYYQAYLGEQAEQAGDYDTAIKHYLAAIKRKKTDAEFYFRLGRLYSNLQKPASSVRYLEQAIEHARVVSERQQYQEFLDRITSRSVAQQWG